MDRASGDVMASRRARSADDGATSGLRGVAPFLALAFVVALLAVAPRAADAHLNGIPTIAWPQTPEGVGEVVDGSYRITWIDFDDQATTGETTIDVHAIRRMPPTYRMGVVPRIDPDDPDHVVIATGIPERNLANAIDWDTSAVAPGTWFVFTVAHDDPFEMWAFGRGAVSVARAGEEPWPAVIVTRPDDSTPVADGSVELRYESFDPDGTGKVLLEATRSFDGQGLVTLAADLPADPSGSFLWDTREVTPGDWTIKATIVDGLERSSSAFGRFFVRVAHRGGGSGGSGGGTGGTGGSGAGAGGAGSSGGDGGGELDPDGDGPGGCGCSNASGGAPGQGFLFLACFLWLVTSRAAHSTRRPLP
ncbi:MAG TPA: hypothetical protein VGD74_10365 [Vulgatibacter sp.]